MLECMRKRDNINNNLCSGYFCSFIIPPIDGRYIKKIFNNTSKYNDRYIFDLYNKSKETVNKFFNKNIINKKLG